MDIQASDRVATVHPEEAGPGPGFTWLRLRLDALGVDRIDPFDRPYARHEEWAVADPGGTFRPENPDAIVVPDVLLEAWRCIAAALPRDPEVLSPTSRRSDNGEDGPSWYGLDLPDGCTLWLRVAPHDSSEAAPVT